MEPRGDWSARASRLKPQASSLIGSTRPHRTQEPAASAGREARIAYSGGAVIDLSLRRVWRYLLAKIETHGQVVHVAFSMRAPISPGVDFQLLQHGNNGAVEVERDTFTEHVERDDLHVVRISHGAPPAEGQGVHRLKSRRHVARFIAVQKSMLFHPGNELVGMVCFLDSVFGKHWLEAFVLAQRVTQAERLRVFARQVNELMDPLLLVGSVGSGEVGRHRTLANLRPVVLRVIKQPLHGVQFLLKPEKQTRQQQVTACRRFELNWLHR